MSTIIINWLFKLFFSHSSLSYGKQQRHVYVSHLMQNQIFVFFFSFVVVTITHDCRFFLKDFQTSLIDSFIKIIVSEHFFLLYIRWWLIMIIVSKIYKELLLIHIHIIKYVNLWIFCNINILNKKEPKKNRFNVKKNTFFHYRWSFLFV
jgi:hypothetical protein